MRLRIASLLTLLLVCNNVAFGQFWEGFFMGVGQAAQQYNYNQRQYNNNTSSTNNGYEKKHRVEDDGYEWYELETRIEYLRSQGYWLTGAPYGAMSISGKTIVPRKFDSIFYHDEDDGYGYFTVTLNGSEGAYSKNGTCLIPTSRGYNGWVPICFHKSEEDGFGYFAVTKNEKEGVCNINGTQIIAPMYDYIIYHSEEGGGYFIVSKGDYRGIYSSSGKQIIEPMYDYISYPRKDGGGYYEVKKGDYRGVYSLSGKQIIEPMYDYIIYHSEDGVGYFKVEKGDYQGVYSPSGKQIIAPTTYESIVFDEGTFKGMVKGQYSFVALNIDINGNPIGQPDESANSNLQSAAFKLQVGKYYRVEAVAYDSKNPEFLPYEAEITLVKAGNEYSIVLSSGDGSGGTDLVEIFHVERYYDNNVGMVYVIDETRSFGMPVGGNIVFGYDPSKSSRVVALFGKNGFLMDPKPYDNPILKRE